MPPRLSQTVPRHETDSLFTKTAVTSMILLSALSAWFVRARSLDLVWASRASFFCCSRWPCRKHKHH